MIRIEPPRGMGEAAAWKASGLSRAGLSRFVRLAQALVGLAGETSVLLADDSFLRQLNREFRSIDKATDVLSFPALAEQKSATAGDLAISLDTAARQAREHGHSLRDEVRILIVHGLLHLAGWDHETDHGEMQAKEADLRRRLRLRPTLIDRVRRTGVALVPPKRRR